MAARLRVGGLHQEKASTRVGESLLVLLQDFGSLLAIVFMVIVMGKQVRTIAASFEANMKGIFAAQDAANIQREQRFADLVDRQALVIIENTRAFRDWALTNSDLKSLLTPLAVKTPPVVTGKS